MQSHQLCVCRAGKSLNPSGRSTGLELRAQPGIRIIDPAEPRELTGNQFLELSEKSPLVVGFYSPGNIIFRSYPLKVILTYCWNITMDRLQICRILLGRPALHRAWNRQQHPVRCEHPLISLIIPLLHGQTAFGKTRHTQVLGAAAASGCPSSMTQNPN